MLALFLLTSALSTPAGAPPGTPHAAVRAASGGRAPIPRDAPPPIVESLRVLALPEDEARAINAAIPFVPDAIEPARAFTLVGSAADRERALTCLAAASWYEAGDDAVGQRAVMQVVLNRLRHPAYPKTVCGVVFQGAERRTGCQFTFTCDGAMVRRPSAAAWTRARALAEAALTGTVDGTVGTATHYHTDWVVPYWSASLDKIAKVGTHLFLRWHGGWGLRTAFTGRYAGGEALDRRLVDLAAPAAQIEPDGGLAEIDATGAPLAAQDRPAVTLAGITARDLRGSTLRLADRGAGEFALQLDAKAFAGDYALAAWALCRFQPKCLVAGWTRPAFIPAALPLTPRALQTVTFLFRKGSAGDAGQALWNCRQVPRSPGQCLPGTEPAGTDAAATPPPAAASLRPGPPPVG